MTRAVPDFAAARASHKTGRQRNLALPTRLLLQEEVISLTPPARLRVT